LSNYKYTRIAISIQGAAYLKQSQFFTVNDNRNN